MEIDYKSLIQDVIQSQKNFLGKELAIGRLKDIPGLQLDAEGLVTSLDQAKAAVIMNSVLGIYRQFLGTNLEELLKNIFAKYSFKPQDQSS